jgi:3',5'-cyclic AMP phosphodiesterase CpdA
MALILHLTDIHIGKDQPTDDHKIEGLIEYDHRHDRFKTYCNTLKSISKYLTSEDRRLDAVVVSGDITVANSEDGFILFEKLISSLGPSKPTNKNIIVVPGNHDVKWGDKKASAKKYEYFLKYVRKAGYTTPFIDSVDKQNKRGVVLNLPLEKIQIVPINTSHYCGTRGKFNKQASWEKAKKVLKTNGKLDLAVEIENGINHLLLHDISRVSTQQLEYLSEKVGSTDKSLFRIAVTHHPLTAVSISEEVKAFEVITNLGEIRNFLLENDFRLLLHGHKHKQAVFWDLIPDLKKTYNESNKQLSILVVSGTQLSADGNLENDICRLIEVKNNSINPTVTIQPINATQSGGRINLGEPTTYQYEKKSSPINRIICGKDISETYNSIIEHYHNEDDKTITNLICEVQSVSNKIDVPEEYPIDSKYSTQAEREKWIHDLVEWWAKKKTSLDRIPFTHGGRLFNFGETPINQIDYIVKALISKEQTSKGIAVLFNPDQDGVEESKRGPHFCLIQFFIVVRDNTKYLDSIAYFRKQEMRHWWLINVAEIINLQNIIIKELDLGRKITGVRNGRVTTIAALAYLGKVDARPLVALPKIDLMFDDENTGIHYGLTDLVYSLIYNEISNREKSKNLWIALLDDMIPKDNPDPNGVPIAIEGLEFLSKRIRKILEGKENREIENLVANLEFLLSKNKAFSEKYINDGQSNKDGQSKQDGYNTWKLECDQLIKTLKSQIEKIYKVKRSRNFSLQNGHRVAT